MTAFDLLGSDFGTVAQLLAAHALERPDKLALADEHATLTYAALDRLTAAMAAALQRDGVTRGAAVAIVAASSVDYAVAFLGAVRAGCAAAPLAPSATPAAIAAMAADCGAQIVLVDAVNADALAGQPLPRMVTFGAEFEGWLSAEAPTTVEIAPDDAFNIIYSSGTTGNPKGIVQSHAMRWAHVARNSAAGWTDAVTMVATPIYSNTTLVSFLPTMGWGGTAVLMPRFDAGGYLRLAERHRATHTMLVPVQYQRLMAHPAFDTTDLSSFRFKTCTSAPFSAALKADVLARWPGLLVEYYGLTEGGGTCALNCSAHPDKLHTVGQPLPGHDIRLIDDEGQEVPPGEAGEVVGRSATMMTGYHGRSDATREAEWFDADGQRYIRHGDIGRFDEDGFLILMDRRKDMIISGGFNIYPSDLEAVLAQHPAVAECTVIGMPSADWGETPVGIYVAKPGMVDNAEVVRAWANERLGKTQRLSVLHQADELPRSAIGKVLKRELRERLLSINA